MIRLSATNSTAIVSTKPWTGGIIRCDQRLDRIGTDAGPGEYLFDQHIGAEHKREHHAERGDDRQQRVAERVGEDDGAVVEASWHARCGRNPSASTASIEARVIRAIGARENSPSVMRRQDQLGQRRPERSPNRRSSRLSIR